MGGGGKGGGGGGQTPAFVREGTQQLAQRSEQLFNLARPLLEQGTSQIADLIRTGGPGANVPIINQAVAAQRGATSRAQAEISGDLRRAGLERTPGGVPGGGPGVTTGGATTGPVTPGGFQPISTIFSSRLREGLQRGGDVAARRIPIRAAAPLVSTAATGALSGGQLAGTGFQGALSALGTSARVGAQARLAAQEARRNTALQFGRNLVNLASAGGFNFLRGLGGGGGLPNQLNPFGAGMSPTGNLIIGPTGTLGGSV